MSSARDARLGFAGGTQVTTIERVRSETTWAEAAGFDSYWLSHVSGVDPVLALASAADATSSIELGTSVVPTAGRHPLALGQLARTAQQACDGRFTLGVGPSHQIVVELAYGQSWASPRARTAEYLAALIPLCNGQPASLNGEHITAHGQLDIPCDPVPVVLAALGPQMLELAGAVTTGTHVGQTGPKTIRSHTAPLIRAAADAAGQPEPRIIALVNLCVGEPSVVRGAAAQGSAGYAALPSYKAMHELEGLAEPTDLILAGTIDDIVEGLADYVDAGATDLRLGVLAPDADHRDATLAALESWIRS